MTEANPCRQCGQMIIYHEGLERMVNFIDGKGGKRGEAHSHRSKQRYQNCNRCNRHFDPSDYSVCPICFGKVCTHCGYLYKSNVTKCKRCLSIYSDQIQLTVYDKETKTYVKKDPLFIQYEIIQIVERTNELRKCQD